MAHTVRDRQKLLNRARRIRGQVEGIERSLSGGETDCSDLMQMIAGCRGAINGLMAEVVESHIREHVVDPKRKPSAAQVDAAEELIDVLGTYLR
jgi:FrmR/RcnR family transcriptional regulator, repressor of frmRAB operon